MRPSRRGKQGSPQANQTIARPREREAEQDAPSHSAQPPRLRSGRSAQTQDFSELVDQVSHAIANAVSAGVDHVMAPSTGAQENADLNLPVREDLQPVAPQERTKPIELQLFRGMGLCLRDAIALDLVTCPDMDKLMARLDRHIDGGVLAPLTVFAMVIFAIQARHARGYPHRSAGWEQLHDHTIAHLPEDLRVEALLVLRCMQGADSDDPTIQVCEKRFLEHCARLSPQAEGELLQKICKMQWWHPAICNFAGHPSPRTMKLIALENMLAVLAPRLTDKDALTQRRCMTFLMESILPVQAETPQDGPLDRDPWKSSVKVWSETAIKLKPETLQWVMSDLQMSMSFEAPELWPHQNAIFLDVVARLELLRAEAQQPAFKHLQPWLHIVFKEACRMIGEQPRLAVSLCMQMLRIVGRMNEPWAKAMTGKLRDAINLKPIVHEAQSTHGLAPDNCKTQ